MAVVKLYSHVCHFVVSIVTTCITSPLAPFTKPSETSTLVVCITRALMASLSALWRPPVSYRLLDSVERSMCAVCPAMASLALIKYCSHCRAKLFNMSAFSVNISIQSVYKWEEGSVYLFGPVHDVPLLLSVGKQVNGGGGNGGARCISQSPTSVEPWQLLCKWHGGHGTQWCHVRGVQLKTVNIHVYLHTMILCGWLSHPFWSVCVCVVMIYWFHHLHVCVTPLTISLTR